jgi:acetolactate synthase-1/2/3 large subunit
VELEIPWDLWLTKADVELPNPEPTPSDQLSVAKLREAAALLSSAARPLILAGGGIITSDAFEELAALAECLGAPVIVTAEGKGAIRDDHHLALGNINMGANPALPQADIILAVGSRFYLSANSIWKLQPNQRVIQIDIDPTELGRNQTIQLGIAADARAALRSLLEILPGSKASQWQAHEFAEIRKKTAATLEEKAPLQSSLIQAIHGELKDDGILVPGITNVGYWCNISYPVAKPRNYLTSSYFGTLGYAFPTALGAKVGNPDRHVVALCGDGGFLYAASELATAVQEGLNVVALVFVDQAYGTCLRIQQRSFGNRFIGTQLHNPDFAKLAESFGALGRKLSHPEELGDALHSALSADRPAVVEVPIPVMSSPMEVFSLPQR